jgi:hypothetical protein
MTLEASIPMNNPIEFEEAEKLSEELFLRVMKKTDGMISLVGLSSWQQNVVLVYHVLGLAGGMGLDEMLDDEMDADPGYVLTIKAFREIGSREMAEILEEGIAIKTSIAIGVDTSSMRDFDALDENFYARERECVTQMGRYIAANKLN